MLTLLQISVMSGAKSVPLKSLIDKLHLTPAQFCRETTLSKPLVSVILAGKKSITSDAIVRILQRYPDVNIDYLLGKSELMFNNRTDCDSIQKELDACKLEVLRLKAELYDLSRK